MLPSCALTPSPRKRRPVRTGREPTLTIGELAARTGLKPATLRMWESRHGFPRAARRDSGHRRYSEQDVELVRQVTRRRDAGLRLEVAIAEVALAQAVAADTPGAAVGVCRAAPSAILASSRSG